MKALVKKYPINAKKPEQNEVYVESNWHDWILEDGFPLTNEGELRSYALCEDCPEDVELTVDNFDVKEQTKTIEDDMGEKVEVKYWTATYIGQ